MSALDDIKARIEAAYPYENTAALGLDLLAALEAVGGLPDYETWEHHAPGMGEVFADGYNHALEVVREVIQDALS